MSRGETLNVWSEAVAPAVANLAAAVVTCSWQVYIGASEALKWFLELVTRAYGQRSLFHAGLSLLIISPDSYGDYPILGGVTLR